jgi:hypothetical protein
VEEGRRRDLRLPVPDSCGEALDLRDDTDAASFASGLLIGADVSARLGEACHDMVHILADPQLGSLYAAAIEAQGATAMIVDSHAAFEAGSPQSPREYHERLAQFDAAFARCPLIAILRGVRPEEVEEIGRDPGVEAGFAIIEVPLNSPDPFDSIARLARRLAGRGRCRRGDGASGG